MQYLQVAGRNLRQLRPCFAAFATLQKVQIYGVRSHNMELSGVRDNMSDNNTIAGWVLFGGIAALGFSIVSGKYFHADSPQRPETLGYIIEGVEVSGGEDTGPAIETLLQTADAAAGEKVFGKCIACHTIDPGGADGIGPNLHAMMGKGIAAGSFAYSGALKEKGGNWDWNAMNDWLASPRKFANGTKMTFAGLGKVEDRANVMAYMNAQGSNIALPAAPVEEAAPEALAEGEAAEAEVAAETAEADTAAATE